MSSANWLMSILHNIFIDGTRLRRAEVQRLARATELVDRVPPRPGWHVRLNQVREAFMELPDEQRAALHLVAIEGLGYAEAAEALSIPQLYPGIQARRQGRASTWPFGLRHAPSWVGSTSSRSDAASRSAWLRLDASARMADSRLLGRHHCPRTVAIAARTDAAADDDGRVRALMPGPKIKHEVDRPQYAAMRGRLPGDNVLGGCCGTDHRHIERILQRVQRGSLGKEVIMLDFNVPRVAALVTAASLENAQRAFDTLTGAFASDSPSGWMFPDEQQYLQYFPIFAKAFGGAPIDRGTALASPDCSGAALWLSSVAGPDQDALAGRSSGKGTSWQSLMRWHACTRPSRTGICR
jgi:Sigma-70, region 4